jgi:hypothetical protein
MKSIKSGSDRRYKRETFNAIITYNRTRLIRHLLLTVKKLPSLRKYQGRCGRTLQTPRQIIMKKYR